MVHCLTFHQPCTLSFLWRADKDRRKRCKRLRVFVFPTTFPCISRDFRGGAALLYMELAALLFGSQGSPFLLTTYIIIGELLTLQYTLSFRLRGIDLYLQGPMHAHILRCNSSPLPSVATVQISKTIFSFLQTHYINLLAYLSSVIRATPKRHLVTTLSVLYFICMVICNCY